MLVRPTATESGEDRIERLLQPWERELGQLLPRPVVLEGDLTAAGLGLDEAACRWIETHCKRVLHNAAALVFHGEDSRGEPWRTNVLGTQRIVELCCRLNIEKLHHVSTAYVCGQRGGTIREDELDRGQGFRNDYEKSKFLAEQIVRAAPLRSPPTIYRPAIVAGDSRTGYSNTYHGLHHYLKLISTMVRGKQPDEKGIRRFAVRWNLRGNERLNVIPVDWVSAVICRLFETPEAHGGTYHLAPAKHLTPKELVKAARSYYQEIQATGLEFVGPDGPVSENASTHESVARESTDIYKPYEIGDPKFDTSQTLRFTADLPCPVIDEGILHRYLAHGEKDQWGRSPQHPAAAPFRVSQYLRQMVGPGETGAIAAGPGIQRVGLDVQGPGGSQWTIAVDAETVRFLEPGLPAKADPAFQIPARVFSQWAQADSTRARQEMSRFTTPSTAPLETPHLDALSRVLFPRSQS